MPFWIRVLVLAGALAPAVAHGLELRVEIGSARAPEVWGSSADRAVRDFAKRVSGHSKGYRASLSRAGLLQTKLVMPTRVILTDRGTKLAFKGRGGSDIVPTFDTTGTRVFPADYKAYLERVFTAAKPAMNAVFGSPAVGGTVRIKNYDADIQDRYAVGGGYYVPNAPTGPEVRFPVYNNRVSAAINYIHTLLLAYMADKQYPWDAYNEGLARAATILVARTPGSIPDSPDPDQIEDALAGLYDVGQFYDVWNKVGLGGPRFIAPNLLNTTLPIGGSTGGVFLLRYQMAGSAWSKVAVRYNGFVAEFNKRFYANPGAYTSLATLEQLGQQVLDFLSGTTGTTIEGLSFSAWAARQSVLDTRLNPGLRLLPVALPLVAQSGTSDFGVFDIVLNAFKILPNGDEILLSATAYPIYWRPDFTRHFTTAQDDVVQVAGAYGSVTPNFPSSEFQGQPYRITVDLPLSGKVARVTVPAGSYSTGSNANPSTFYGSVSGLPNPGSTPYRINLSWVGGALNGIAVTNNAFGAKISDANYLRPGPVTVRVLQGTATVMTREVVKSKGGLMLDLVPPESFIAHSFSLAARLTTLGLPVEPLRPNAADVLGLPDGQTLVARWDSTIGRYQLYPDDGEIKQGAGYWVRPPSAINRTVIGRSVPGIPFAVSLNPGWNQVSVPFNATLPFTSVSVTVAAEAIGTYEQAVDDGTLGPTVFQFQPGSNLDEGTMVPATTFAPGRSYFVRANRPEGAVLVFTPPGGTRKTGGGSGRRAPNYTKTWDMKVALMDSRGTQCGVTLGQAAGATNNLDLVIDSELPPTKNGFQLTSYNGRTMFTDFRPTGSRPFFDLRLKGLRVGQRYILRFKPSTSIPGFVLRDGSRTLTVSSNQDYGFVATGTTRRVTLEALR